MAAAAIPLAVAAIGAGTAAYSQHEQNKNAEASRDAMAEAQRKANELPKLPDTQGLASSMQAADVQARTAGGTILSNQRQNQQIGDNANGTRKTLLGT